MILSSTEGGMIAVVLSRTERGTITNEYNCTDQDQVRGTVYRSGSSAWYRVQIRIKCVVPCADQDQVRGTGTLATGTARSTTAAPTSSTSRRWVLE
jgi:hypothetical protein